MKFQLLEYSEFNLAFQLQFGTYEAKSENIFDGRKKNAISTSGFQDK